MGRRLRMYQAEGVYFVTARTFQGRFLIQQVAQANQVIGGVLARAARLTGVAIHAYVVASNHLHLVCSARDGVLSSFMKYVLGNLSKKLGQLINWTGSFWGRRFSAEPIFGPDAEEGLLRYVLSHGVKEGLVRRSEHWPGLATCLELLQNVATKCFPFFRNRSGGGVGDQ